MPGHAGTAAGPGNEPSEEELRAAYEAELSRSRPTDMIAQAAVSLLNIGARRLGLPAERAAAAAPGARPTARPRAGARRDRRRAGAAGRSSSAGSRRSCDRCATRSRSCRWPTRVRSQARAPKPRPPSRQAPSPATPTRPASRAAVARRGPPAANPRRMPASSRRVPGRRSRAAGCGCRDGERDRRFVPDRRTPAGTPPAGTIDCARVCTG